jgi:glyoxalase superfamily protein
VPGIQIVIDCADAAQLVPFWGLALDYVPSPPPEGFATWNEWYRSVGVPDEELDLTGDGTDRLIDPNGVGPPIWFQPVPEVKLVKNRLHLDIHVGRDDQGVKFPFPERRRRVRAKADQLIAAGASELRVEDNPEYERFSVTLADPEGNEFCLV